MEFSNLDTGEGIYRGFVSAESEILEEKQEQFWLLPAEVPPQIKSGTFRSPTLAIPHVLSSFGEELSKAEQDAVTYMLNTREVRELTGYAAAIVGPDFNGFLRFKIHGVCRCGGHIETSHDLRIRYLGYYQWFWKYIMDTLLAADHCCFDAGTYEEIFTTRTE